MNIVARKREFSQVLVHRVPKKVTGLFLFGYDTLVSQDIQSTRSNARRVMGNWFTAKSKMWRLLRNDRIAEMFPELLAQLSHVHVHEVIAIDFSDFGDGRQVLMFARQTRRGRAIPVYFEILEYPIEKDSQNTFVINAIKRFFAYARCTPTLVFDRGFACPSIIDFLAQHNYRFIMRIKKRKSLDDLQGHTYAAESFEKNDGSVHAYGRCGLRF